MGRSIDIKPFESNARGVLFYVVTAVMLLFLALFSISVKAYLEQGPSDDLPLGMLLVVAGLFFIFAYSAYRIGRQKLIVTADGIRLVSGSRSEEMAWKNLGSVSVSPGVLGLQLESLDGRNKMTVPYRFGMAGKIFEYAAKWEVENSREEYLARLANFPFPYEAKDNEFIFTPLFSLVAVSVICYLERDPWLILPVGVAVVAVNLFILSGKHRFLHIGKDEIRFTGLTGERRIPFSEIEDARMGMRSCTAVQGTLAIVLELFLKNGKRASINLHDHPWMAIYVKVLQRLGKL